MVQKPIFDMMWKAYLNLKVESDDNYNTMSGQICVMTMQNCSW